MWNDKEITEFDPYRMEGVYKGLVEAQKLAYSIAMTKGWYNNIQTGEKIERNFGEVIALMHSELSEALEADRKGIKFDSKLTDKDAVAVELADCIIRILDTAAARNLNIADAFISKCLYNMNREDHKIENRGKEGGKRY